mgnify:CR=1 FL=1
MTEKEKETFVLVVFLLYVTLLVGIPLSPSAEETNTWEQMGMKNNIRKHVNIRYRVQVP